MPRRREKPPKIPSPKPVVEQGLPVFDQLVRRGVVVLPAKTAKPIKPSRRRG